METRLVPIGNSFGIRIPIAMVRQFNLDQCAINLIVRKEGILITPIANVPPLEQWDKLFRQALFRQTKKNEPDPKIDENNFSYWDITLTDGIE